ncbi:MAG: T9SS type A sorting domain-containing protein [bacterium]
MKKVDTLWVSGMFNYLNFTSGIKYLVFFLILIANINNCFSNNILWERFPSILNDLAFIRQRNLLYSYDGKYIITHYINLDKNYVIVSDATTGVTINKRMIKSENENNRLFLSQIFSLRDTNIIACEIEDTLSNIYYFKVPSLELVKKDTQLYYFNELSPNFDNAVYFSSYEYSNTFTVFSLEKIGNSKIIYKDTAYNTNPDPKNRWIHDVKYSLDGKYLIVITHGAFADVSIYDIYQKKMLWHDNNTEPFNNAVISDDSKYIILTTSTKIYIYDFYTGLLINEMNHIQNNTFGVYSNISHDNKYVSSIDNYSEITIYNAVTDEVVSNFHCLESIIDLPSSNYVGDFLYDHQFSKDNNKLLVSGTETHYLFDINTSKILTLYSTNNCYPDEYPGILKFANNDEYLITLGPDKTIIWDAKTGKFVKMLNLARNSEQINQVALSVDSKQLIYKSDNKIYLYNFVDEVLTDEIEVSSNVLQLAVSGNGKYIGYTLADSSFAIYDLEAGRVVYSRKENFSGYHEDDIRFYSISFSPDSLCSVTLIGVDKWLGFSYYTNIYNFFEDRKINEFSEGYPIEFLNSDSMALGWASNSYPTRLLKYSVKYKDYITQKEYYQDGIKSLAINKTGTHFVTTGPTIWNIETGDSIQLHADPELSDMDYVAVSDNGKMLAAMSPEGRIVVWDVEKYLTPVEEKPITKKNVLNVYPNPTSNTINIRYRNESAGIVNIFLTDVLGNQTLLKSENKLPGDYVETFNMNDFLQGIYNIILQINEKIYSESVVVMK